MFSFEVVHQKHFSKKVCEFKQCECLYLTFKELRCATYTYMLVDFKSSEKLKCDSLDL